MAESLSMPFLEDHPQIKVIREIVKRRKIKIYLVGGFLRDDLLKQPCLDFDFAVEKDAILLARQFAKKIRGAFVLLDAERGCGRVAKKEGGTVKTYDFADFRASTFRKDLLHRDFTINTLSLQINSLKNYEEIQDVLLDFKNGLRDLKQKRIKAVSSFAFKEDPLRLLRAFSLKATLGFHIDPKTLKLIQKQKDLIRQAAGERIREEFFKILISPRSAENLKSLHRVDLLEKIIPQIALMYNVRQGAYHHLDVFKHSLETVVQLERVLSEFAGHMEIESYIQETLAAQHPRYALMKLAALLHDIGKPQTLKRENGKFSFHGHERVGKIIVKGIARSLKLSSRERFKLGEMVLWHLRPGYLSNFKQPSERSIFRYFRDTGEEAVSILLLSLADQRATCGPLTTNQDQVHHEKICKMMIDRYFELKRKKPFVRLINGHDLINKLKLEPSPLFKKILREVEEQQATGTITTKKQALDLAAKIAREKSNEN